MLGGRQGAVSSRVFVGPIQTGTGVGYIGIDGESIIYRIQMAEVRWDVSSSVSVTGGIVEDLWVESGNEAWGLREVEAAAAEYQNWMTRGAPGMSAKYVLPQRFGSITVSTHTGEGSFRLERNSGKNTNRNYTHMTNG